MEERTFTTEEVARMHGVSEEECYEFLVKNGWVDPNTGLATEYAIKHGYLVNVKHEYNGEDTDI